MKDEVIDQTPKRIAELKFETFTPIEIKKNGVVELTNRDLYLINEVNSTERVPAQYGPLDLRLGSSVKTGTCETCGLSQQHCIGHFGFIKLALPVFHIGYFKNTLNLCQCICKECARILLPPQHRQQFLKELRRPNISSIQREAIIRKVTEACRKVRRCPYCSSINGPVKKFGPFRIIHEKYKNMGSQALVIQKTQFEKTFDYAISVNADIHRHLARAIDNIDPQTALKLFEMIAPQDYDLLGIPRGSKPANIIWQYVPAPPSCIRPTIPQESATTEDDLTQQLSQILWLNGILHESLKEKGVDIRRIIMQWDMLAHATAIYINATAPGLTNSQEGSKPQRSFAQRLKGKQGRFRGNLSGKRVDFSGRTVISPDPNLKIDEVAVPERVAMIMTYPERVNAHNKKLLQEAILRGHDKHPGAIAVTFSNGSKKSVKYADRKLLAKELKIGDIVDRHIRDGDIVLFNRQPSLHKLSILSHRVKVRPYRTFRLNECVCEPYNADFDGDEMNLHVPQTEEARIEATQLMSVQNNLVSPRNGNPIIAAIQDFITASFLMSRKDNFYDRKTFCQICSYMVDANIHIDIPEPAILKPRALWTGKQIFNVLMRPNRSSPVKLNFECRTKSFQKPKNGLPNDMCERDGYLIVRNSQVMCGVFDKETIGAKGKRTLFYVIMRDYGAQEAADAMCRLSKLSARWLSNFGFSVGINDVQPGGNLKERKDELVGKAYDDVKNMIQESNEGKMEAQAGCDQDQTLENKISGTLNKVREEAGQICVDELPKTNAPLIMATSGSKGSFINVSQMVACVGQQIISSKRIPDGFQDRSLPHFEKKSKMPAAKGFVRNSFYSGLTPSEFLFHAVTGREGLVDTAVKTAETGYMSRRLIKSLEDLSCQYDMTVRDATGNLVQFKFGDDGLDPTNLEGDDSPVDFIRTWTHIQNLIDDKDDNALLPNEVMPVLESFFDQHKFRKNCSDEFAESTTSFVQSLVDRLIKIRQNFGFPAPGESEMDIDYDPEDANVIAVNNILKITKPQMDAFIILLLDKYHKAKLEYGTAVGALGAQSIGEPGTQMTLKTFHFAGVASMNITLGVPRIKEIISAAKNISTPIITAKLENDTDQRAARIVKARLEKCVLGDITQYIEDVFGMNECHIEIRLDWETIRKLGLELTIEEIRKAIINSKKLKLKARDVFIRGDDIVKIFMPDDILDKGDIWSALQRYMRDLPIVIVKGIPTISRAVISELDKEPGHYHLLVEGYGLREVMNTEGIVGRRTTTNHVADMRQYLGIEAARQSIINEIQYTMKEHGMAVDPRHIMLLGDVMTYRGEIDGINRVGVAKIKDSILHKASFERTVDHLFDAAAFGKVDAIEGVTASIVMGIPMTLGTGSFDLRNAAMKLPPKKIPLFESKVGSCL